MKKNNKQAKGKTPDKNTSIKGIKTFFSTIERERKREGEPAFQWAILGKHWPNKSGPKSKRMIWIHIDQWRNKGSLFFYTLLAMTHSQGKAGGEVKRRNGKGMTGREKNGLMETLDNSLLTCEGEDKCQCLNYFKI